MTGNFGSIEMTPIVKEVQESATITGKESLEAVRGLRVPKEISGEVDMLIGIKYLSIFPEPVFSTPEGLTIFKSKFLPQVAGEIACIAILVDLL